jgi:hypothetical protein
MPRSRVGRQAAVLLFTAGGAAEGHCIVLCVAAMTTRRAVTVIVYD